MFVLPHTIRKIRNSKNTFYINFEDERLINPTVKDLTNLLPTIQETFDLSESPINLFVDEIQNVDNWEKWARRIAEKDNIYLFLSGSSSKLTSREISTSLRGRTLTTYIFPLSFKEFLKFHNFEYDTKNIEYSKKRHKIKKFFWDYLEYGGFPEVVLSKENKSKILREYFSTILARDIIERYEIEKIQALESFMKLLINNFSRLISFSKAENWMKSMGIEITKATLIEYFNYIKSSFSLFDVQLFSHSIKDRLQYPRKIYLIDNGFASVMTDRFSSDRGWFFENLVAVELFKKVVPDPSRDIFYWKNSRNEVDFLVKRGVEVEKLIQVCSNLTDENKKREIKSLLKASEELGCKTSWFLLRIIPTKKQWMGKRLFILLSGNGSSPKIKPPKTNTFKYTQEHYSIHDYQNDFLQGKRIPSKRNR